MSRFTEERKALWSEYNKAKAGGFCNVNVWDYFEDDDVERQKRKQLFRTPWMFHKQPVLVRTISGLGREEPLEVMAFYAEDSKGDEYNITNLLLQGKDKMQNSEGRYINTERAVNYMEQLSDATKLLPHVQMCEEYMPFMNWFCGVRGWEKPTISQYTDEYLSGWRDSLQSGSAIVVGRITSIQDLHYAYESAEPYIRYMQQNAQKPRNQQAVKKSRGFRDVLSRIFN